MTHEITISFGAAYPRGFAEAHAAAVRVMESITMTEPDAEPVKLSIDTYEQDDCGVLRSELS